MKPENEEKVTGLPENAYQELKEGESYVSFPGGYGNHASTRLWRERRKPGETFDSLNARKE